MLSFLNLDSLAGKAVQAAMTLQASIEKTIQETQSEFEAEVRKNELRKEEEQKKPKVTPGEVCPLWTVFAEKQSILEGELQKRVLELSEKEELFVTPSSASDTFDFDLTSSLPFALRALQEDPRLEKMRFKLVPKRVSEQKFFQRYFCAVQKARADIGVDAFPFSVSAATIRPATTHASSDDSIARLEHALAGDGSELDTDADLDHANGAKTPGDVSDIEADLAAVLAQPTIPSTPPSVQRTPSKFSMSAATPATPQSPTVVFSSTSLPPTPQSAAPSTNKPVASPVAQSPAPSASTNSLTGLPIDHHVDLTDDTLESLLADVTLGGNNIEMSKELEDELNASLEEITGESL